jgi:1,4-dihydroxy-2-naphthoate octaprenyltransferase
MQDGGPAQMSDQGAIEALVAPVAPERDARRTRPLAEESPPAPVAAPTATPVGTLVRWLRVARAPLLLCSAAPVMVTGALLWAQGVSVSLPLLGLTLLAALLVQAGAQLLDVYLEHVRTLTLLHGDPNSSVARMPNRPPGLLITAEIYPLDALRVAAGLLVAGAGLGVPLALAGGWPSLLLGLGGLLVAFLYSATSYALKRHPLGEPAILLALGPGIVALTLLVQRHPVTPLALAIGTALGLFAMSLVAAANLRALAPEIRSGRKTLVRLLGRTGGRRFFLGSLLAAYALVVGAALFPGAPHGALAVLFSLPIAALPLTGGLRAHSAPTLDLVVTDAVRAYAFFAFWLVVGLLLGGLFLRLLSLLGS